MKTRTIILAATLAVSATAVGRAQAPGSKPSPDALPQPPAGTPQTAVAPQAPMSPELQIPLGTPVGFSTSGYDDGLRRDPFVSLIMVKRNPMNPSGIRPGTSLRALTVADVKVTGIQRVNNKLQALLEGPNRMSFTAKPQDSLLDGLVKSVDSEGVVFVEQVTDAAGTVRSHEVRKLLRPAEVIR